MHQYHMYVPPHLRLGVLNTTEGVKGLQEHKTCGGWITSILPQYSSSDHRGMRKLFAKFNLFAQESPADCSNSPQGMVSTPLLTREPLLPTFTLFSASFCVHS